MKSILSGRGLRKALSALLAVIMFFGSWFELAVPALSLGLGAEKPYVLLDGEKVEKVTLQENAKLRFQAVSDIEPAAYQWQIKDPGEKDRWINVSGGQSKFLWVTHALVGSMLSVDSTAQLRCRMTVNSKETCTDPIKVVVSLQVEEPDVKEQPILKARMFSRTRASDGEHITYSIVINYLFDDNTIAFEPYGASVAAGSSFHETIKSPAVLGYAPFRRVGDDYVDATEVKFNLDNIQENITINVIYEPALVHYSIHHHLQNILDDEYSVNYDLVTTKQALTGSIVGDGLALSETELPGFKPLAYEKLVVAADGSTVIEIRYDRNYYLIDFDMNGGYGTEPVYTRFGATVGANVPIRHGYVFDGWELVSVGGQPATVEQQGMYALPVNGTITVPAANLRYRARWITQETTYTMVFWRENADDSGYSYWGYLEHLPAMSGSYVSGQDYISRVSGIDDEQYFTFNTNKTDKNILVEGDGSTVVNVYYTRNYYKINFVAPGRCSIEPGHTHGDACYEYICGQDHVHSATCLPELECTTPEHLEHTAQCIICGKQEHVHGGIGCECKIQKHSHGVECWGELVGSQNTPNGAPSNPQNGQIYRRIITRNYYIYLFGVWYRYNGQGVSSGDIVDPPCGKINHTHGTDCSCNLEEHLHEDKCYRDVLHTHTDTCYRYSCGEQEHIHDSACRRLICSITQNHSHSNACNNATSNSTVKTVYKKYDQSIDDLWPVTDDHGKTYNNGERWDPSNTTIYTEVLVFIDQMPPDDFTLTLSTSDASTKTMNYYLQVLPGEAYDVTYNGKNYKLDNVIRADYNFITKAEDFFDIRGFVQSASNPAFNNDGQINNATTANFYYDRITDHYLEFNNNGETLDDKRVHGIMYGANLSQYNFVPSYPTNLEPNAYSFGGWYTSPGCFDGTEVNWNTLTMPEGDLMLYAKWVPITHTVRVFKDANMTEQIGQSQTVAHKAFASAPSGDVTNGNYVFQGWFYKDEVNGVKVEKAFSFTGIPVLKDMDIYAKWSSHVSVNYKIYYKLKGTDIDIADPTVGSAIAGHNKTFDAKAGDQLYSAYQTGYYPETNSHTITMSVDGNHEFTFEYVFVESMPYKVQYINAATGQKLCEDKIVMDNGLSVVTETFRRFDKMMPDAYQKRLVLSATGPDKDENGIWTNNVITFYYNADDQRAYYRVVHYIENISGDDYREYRSEEAVGQIGKSITANALTLTGFDYNSDKTVINGVVTPSDGTTVTTILGDDGALIELYYDRKSYEYVVKYLDGSSGAEIYAEKKAMGVFGEQLAEYAVDLEDEGYTLVSNGVKTLTISANREHNIIEFLYQEQTVALKYHIVGPAACGVLTQYSENLTAISGRPNGSAPIVYNGFVFLGWYTDEACTVPVDPAWVDSATNRLLPLKTGDVWTPANYYAKFAALETDLTITTKSTAAIDENQVFIFNIKGKAGTETAGIDLTVTVVGNNSVTVTKLPTGDYTVTELCDWSWRYENATAQREITLSYNDNGNEIVFDNGRENGKWLDGNAVTDNQF